MTGGVYHGSAWESDGVDGAPRTLADLRDDGEVVSRKTVAKIMRHERIAEIGPATWHPVTTTPEGAHTIPDLAVADQILALEQGRLAS